MNNLFTLLFFVAVSTAGIGVQVGCTFVPETRKIAHAAPEKEGVVSWPQEDPRVELEVVLPGRRSIFRLRGKWTLNFQRPYGVAFDGTQLLAADPGAGRIFRLGANRILSRSAEGFLKTPLGISVCSDGIMVSDPPAGKVLLFDEKLRFSRTLAEGLQRPTGTACIGNRHFVVETGAHRLVELTAGVPRHITGGRGGGEGSFNFPAALATDGRTLWVGDTLNGRIQQIDPDSGDVLTVFGQAGDAPGNMPRTKGIAVDAVGDIWISDALLDQIALYDREGRYLMSIGRRGSGQGELNFPAGLAADKNGRVAVADSLNRRIQVFMLVKREGR